MELASGSIFIRRNETPMKKGETVLGHAHNFDHTTMVTSGRLEVALLKVSEFDSLGRPLKSSVEHTEVIGADDYVNFMLVLAGKWHVLVALEDGTRYSCVYSHTAPQALVEGGTRPAQTKRDENGDLWLKADPSVLLVTHEWADAYR